MVLARFSRLSLLAAAALSTMSVHATESMKIPDNVNVTMRLEEIQENPIVHQLLRRGVVAGSGKVSIGYYPNWAIYDGSGNFKPSDIAVKGLTHILYSFADTNPSTGRLTLTDQWADEQKTFGNEKASGGNNLYGCIGALYKMKLQYRGLKVLLSVGGYTYSQNGHFKFVTSPKARKTFVADAVKIVEDYGFDGIDFDFEYPASAEEGRGLGALFTELRKAFNALQKKKGDKTPYQLTAAVGAGADGYGHLDVPAMDAALNYWNLMAYDYSGSWSRVTGNHANLKRDGLGGVSTVDALAWYKGAGATPAKMALGIPIYGRGFENTDGLGKSYKGVGSGTSESGIYSYKNLPYVGSEIFENTASGSSYSYDKSKREFISYDTPAIAALKGKYVADKGLAGTMYWDLSTDKKGKDAIVASAAGASGALDKSDNHINYPNSKWDNVRNNMGQKKARREHVSHARAPHAL
ncbi:glycoside hydrolase family 18 protein [Schizophyllum amplum]|uniref:Glycoside hydrolase family 18 protein n=1 Tax=Schizophyllum amplum TaxID=97359 RepID=A0A550CV79_9AGAR|nr:glycoside hydrolase family 18 protein [Auriculariopsis ampla]